MPEIILLAVLLLLGLGGYWAMVLFPRQRDFQKRQQMARTLSAGDEVITYGGIIGKVQRIDGDMGIAHVEIADGVIVQVVNAAIMQRYDRAEIARHAKMGPGTSDAAPNPAPINEQA